MSSTTIKSKIGVEDINLSTGNSGVSETFTRDTSTGGILSLTKLDASHIKFKTALTGGPKSIEDLVDGGNDVSIGVNNLTMAGTFTGTLSPVNLTIQTALTVTSMNSAGFVKNTAAGLLSGGNTIAVADLPTAIPATNIGGGAVDDTEYSYLDGVTSPIQTQINSLSAAGFAAASQANMEAGSSAVVGVTPAVSQHHKSACKAWGAIDGTSGTPSLISSYNIDNAITDNGTGAYALTWTTDFSSADYCIVLGIKRDASYRNYINVDNSPAPATTGMSVECGYHNTTLLRDVYLYVAAYGDQ